MNQHWLGVFNFYGFPYQKDKKEGFFFFFFLWCNLISSLLEFGVKLRLCVVFVIKLGHLPMPFLVQNLYTPQLAKVDIIWSHPLSFASGSLSLYGNYNVNSLILWYHRMYCRFFFFFRESFNIQSPLLMITETHINQLV